MSQVLSALTAGLKARIACPNESDTGEKSMLRFTISLLIFALASVPVLAGAPLKGVDVKLGRKSGGFFAARTTTADGSFNFGVLPKGSYVIKLGGAGGTAVLKLEGVSGGTVEKALAIANGSATARLPAGVSVQLEILSDGRHTIRGQLSSQF